MNKNILIVAAGLLAIGSLGIRAQEGNGDELGGPRTGKTKALEAGAELLQSEAPLVRSTHMSVASISTMANHSGRSSPTTIAPIAARTFCSV